MVTTGGNEAVFQDDAGEFEDALTFCRRAGYRPELAWSCCDYADSLAIGHEEASQRFRVDYHCAICGNLTTVESSREKEAIASYMLDHGCRSCPAHKTESKKTASLPWWRY